MSEEKVIVAYKAMKQDFTCRGFQFEVGKTYEHQGRVIACESGFHAVQNPLDMFSYYDLIDSKFCSVELSGELARHGEDSKIAAGRITIKAEIGLPQIITDAVRWIMDLCKDVKEGSDSVQSTSGYSSQLAASGYYSQLAASGDSSQLAASGDYSQLAASGKKSIVMAAANGCTATVGEDGCIALAWWDSKAERFRVAVGYVGEDGIEANVAYCVRDGKLAKVDGDDDDDA